MLKAVIVNRPTQLRRMKSIRRVAVDRDKLNALPFKMIHQGNHAVMRGDRIGAMIGCKDHH